MAQKKSLKKKAPKKKAPRKTKAKGSETLLLVGTVKGAFILRSRDRKTWTRSAVLFPGMQVYALCHDPRSGRLLAGVSHPFFGTNVRYSDDLGKTWVEPKEANIKFPEDAGLVRSDVSATEPHKAKLDNVWQLVPGVEPGRIWAGVQPAALFKSGDGGATFEMVRTLWDHPHRAKWNPGAGGLCLHTIVPHPADGKTVHVAISAAGVYRTDDGGQTWAAKNKGVRVDFAPEKYPEFGQCVHKIARHPSAPDRFYMQNHGGLYRSDDAGESWHDVAHGVPSDFGFSMVVHPHDPDTAFIAPLNQEMRAGPGGKLRIYKTTDGAKSWKPLTGGLAQKDAYETILRDGMACDAGEPAGVYFGTRSGKVFASRDEGASFAVIADALPAVTCVKTGALA
jgi:hypothetical protein